MRHAERVIGQFSRGRSAIDNRHMNITTCITICIGALDEANTISILTINVPFE